MLYRENPAGDIDCFFFVFKATNCFNVHLTVFFVRKQRCCIHCTNVCLPLQLLAGIIASVVVSVETGEGQRIVTVRSPLQVSQYLGSKTQ